MNVRNLAYLALNEIANFIGARTPAAPLVGFAFPESCRVAQRVPKALFAEHAAFGALEKRLFKDEVAEVRCEYVLDAAKEVL